MRDEQGARREIAAIVTAIDAERDRDLARTAADRSVVGQSDERCDRADQHRGALPRRPRDDVEHLVDPVAEVHVRHAARSVHHAGSLRARAVADEPRVAREIVRAAIGLGLDDQARARSVYECATDELPCHDVDLAGKPRGVDPPSGERFDRRHELPRRWHAERCGHGEQVLRVHALEHAVHATVRGERADQLVRARAIIVGGQLALKETEPQE